VKPAGRTSAAFWRFNPGEISSVRIRAAKRARGRSREHGCSNASTVQRHVPGGSGHSAMRPAPPSTSTGSTSESHASRADDTIRQAAPSPLRSAQRRHRRAPTATAAASHRDETTIRSHCPMPRTGAVETMLVETEHRRDHRACGGRPRSRGRRPYRTAFQRDLLRRGGLAEANAHRRSARAAKQLPPSGTEQARPERARPVAWCRVCGGSRAISRR